MKTKIANYILYFLFYFTWRKFWRKSKNIQRTQEVYLQTVLNRNAQTLFGKEHQFQHIKTVAEFQKCVSVSNYEDYISYIEKIQDGEQNILSHEPVKKFSLSSGTASASKLIPNTQSLIDEFDKSIGAWLFDLYKNVPQLLNGRAFWIITPSTKTTETQSAIDKGFDNDSEYFSPLKQWFLKNIFAVSDEVAQYCEGDNYYFALAVFLLAEKELRLISVWNPSVLLILLNKIVENKAQIIQSIESGKLLFPVAIDISSKSILEKFVKRNPVRAGELEVIFATKNENTDLWSAIWPRLALISAWDSSWASVPAKQVKRLFSKVVFQGKGLLATEAAITFPIFDGKGGFYYVPALASHFFEFEHISTSEIKLLHELEPDENYEVIVTTGGGLYRYRLNDVVCCYGFHKKLPLLRFEGKSNIISDIAGEKLHESHVSMVVVKALKELDIDSSFYFLAPEIQPGESYYTLFINSDKDFDIIKLKELLEAGLCENFHYQHCRKLGQLIHAQVQCLGKNAIEKFYETIQSTSHLGTEKQLVLRKDINWKSKLV